MFGTFVLRAQNACSVERVFYGPRISVLGAAIALALALVPLAGRELGDGSMEGQPAMNLCWRLRLHNGVGVSACPVDATHIVSSAPSSPRGDSQD